MVHSLAIYIALIVFHKVNHPKEKLNHPKETNNLLKTNHQKTTKSNEAPIELDHTFVSDKVPQTFVQLVKYFFSDAKTIEKYWHMVQIAAFRFECNLISN
jgi:hypothetical protein